MNRLALQKKLLIAESELNRAQSVQEWQTLAEGVRTFASRARTISLWASAATTLVAGLMSFRRKKSAPAVGKHSWLSAILKSAGLVSTFWSVFRPRPKL